RVQVKQYEDLGSAGASYQDGQIRLKANDLYNQKDTAGLIERMYHEFAHNEQDSLIVRNLADELKVGGTATAEQKQQIAEVYKQRTGSDLSTNHLDEVLRVRDGKPLTPEQQERAQLLTDA